MNMNRFEEPIPRGPGRRTNAEKYAEQNEAHHSKFPTTIDIKFDAKNSENQVKEDALNKYQENAYLLGKIFCVGDVEQTDSEVDDEGSSDSNIDEAAGASDEEVIILRQQI